MKVLRKQEIETANIQVGDQIVIRLAELGEFTATAHKVTDEGVLFIFDDYVTQRPMNDKSTNEGGFEKSDLKKWMDTVLFMAFPGWLRNYITNLSIPTVGELFGDKDEWNKSYFEMDTDEQLPLMKERKNRVVYFNNYGMSGWLRNITKNDYSESYFARVGIDGDTCFDDVSIPAGIRPEFTLVKEKSRDHVFRRDRESLQMEISEKKNEIRILKQEIENLEEKEMYKKAGLEVKRLRDVFVEAGFTKDEALYIVLELSKTLM